MGFFTGIACAFRGLGRLVATPSLWAYAWAPVLLALGIAVAVVERLRGVAAERAGAWARDAVGDARWAEWVVTVLVWAAAAVILFFVFSALVRVVAAPLLALLADRTVAKLTGRPSPAAPGGPLVRWLLRPIGEALAVLLLRLSVTAAALPLLFVPVAGSALFALVTFALLGLDLVDVAQSGRGVVLRRRLAFAARHWDACLGLGVAAGLVLLVPFVNCLLLPALVVAAVLLDAKLAPDFPKAVAA